jgi:hypothetical protein
LSFKLFVPARARLDLAIRHTSTTVVKVTAQKILPILIPALAAVLRVPLEVDDWGIGKASAFVVVNALGVAEKASVDETVDKWNMVVVEWSIKVEAAETNEDGTNDTAVMPVVLEEAIKVT